MGNHIPSWSWARRGRLPHPPRGHPSNTPSTTMCWRLPAPYPHFTAALSHRPKGKKREEKICTVIQSFQITSPFMRSHNSAEDRGLPALSSTASCCPLPAPRLLRRPVPTLCRLQQPRGLCERQEKRLRPCHRQAGWPLSPLFASALLTVCGGCPNQHGCTPFASFPLPFPWCLPGFQPPSASPAADDLILTSQHLFNALLGAEELCLVAAAREPRAGPGDGVAPKLHNSLSTSPGITQGEITDFTASEHAENNPKSTVQPPRSICPLLELPVTPGFPPPLRGALQWGCCKCSQTNEAARKRKSIQRPRRGRQQVSARLGSEGVCGVPTASPATSDIEGSCKKNPFSSPRMESKKKKEKDICSLERFMFPLQKLSRGPGSARCRC